MDRKIVLYQAMLKVGVIKVGVILVGIVLICSLIGIGAGGFIPAERTKEVIAVNYNHQGKFSYEGYSASNLFSGETAQPNPTLFPPIIEGMEILFSSSGIEGETKIKLILEDKGGNWQKEIPVEITGSSPVSFPLDWKEMVLFGETLNAGVRGEDLGELKALSEEELKALSEAKLSELIDAKLSELSETEIEALITAKLSELSETELKALSEAEVEALSEEVLSELKEAKLEELSKTKLSEAKLKELIEEKLKEAKLSEAELKALNEEKLKELKEEKLKALSKEEVKALSDLKDKLLKKGSGFQLKIITEVGTGSDLFTMTLEGDLSSSALKWKEEGFSKIERGFPGGNDWREGAFGYRVKLKENELLPTTLERKPELPQTSAVQSDFSLFTALVESLDVGFDYRFDCDTQINSLEEEIKAWMVVEEPGRWKKSFTLLAPTKKQGEIILNLPLDIDKLRVMAADIDEEIGSKGTKGQEITVFAQVHTIAQTNSGIIDEVFDHQLRGKIGETLDFGVTETKEAKNLALTKEGTITKKVVEPNPLSPKLRKSSLIGLGVSFPILCALAFLYWRKRQKPSFLEEELKRNRKKYKELISEVTDFPPTKGGETIIDTSSLEDLVSISNNSLKPILLRVESEKHTYWVVDGLIIYRYVANGG